MSESQSKRDKDKMADLVRKAIYLGAGTLFYTQENASRRISEGLKVSRDVANDMVSQWDRGKQELIDSITQTVATYLTNLDLTDVLRNVTRGAELEIKVRLNFDDDKRGSAQQPTHESTRERRPLRRRKR